MMSPFSVAVQARPRTVLQFRSNHFSTLAASVKRSGVRELAIGGDGFAGAGLALGRRVLGMAGRAGGRVRFAADMLCLPELGPAFGKSGKGGIGLLRGGRELGEDGIARGIGEAGHGKKQARDKGQRGRDRFTMIFLRAGRWLGGSNRPLSASRWQAAQLARDPTAWERNKAGSMPRCIRCHPGVAVMRVGSAVETVAKRLAALLSQVSAAWRSR